MKKYSLRRLGSLITAGALVATLCSCNHEPENTPDLQVEESNSIVINITPEPTETEEVTIIEETTREFIFDSEAPIVLPIERVTMEDGTIGYKLPKYYIPYEVNSTKPIPGIVPVLEETDEYKIIGNNGYVTNPDGTVTIERYEGAVAVYWPYITALNLYSTDYQAYTEKMQETQEEYGKNSIQYRIFLQTPEIEALAINIYWSTQDNYNQARELRP